MHTKVLKRFPILALFLALAACGQPAVSTPTVAPPATVPAATTLPEPTTAPAEPTAPPEPTATAVPADEPTTVPEPATAANGVLPAPLLFITNENELARMETDGATIVTLTDEQNLMIDFVVSPADSSLAYLTIAENSPDTTLVRTNADGSNRVELAHGIIRGLTFAQDGSIQAGVLGETTSADGSALQPGAWNFPADGSAPALLAPATEPTQAADGSTAPGFHYQPIAWSPDGSKLLMRLTLNMGPDAPSGDIASTGLALYDVGGIQLRELLPLGQEPLCIEPAWSNTSDAIVCANAGAVGAPTPALWRLELASGEQQILLPATEPLVTTFSPRDTPEGLFVLAGTYTDNGLSLKPQRISPEGQATDLLGQPLEAGYDGGLWAPDGSGVIVGRPTASANRTIIWQPLDQSAGVELMTGSIGKLAWVPQP